MGDLDSAGDPGERETTIVGHPRRLAPRTAAIVHAVDDLKWIYSELSARLNEHVREAEVAAEANSRAAEKTERDAIGSRYMAQEADLIQPLERARDALMTMRDEARTFRKAASDESRVWESDETMPSLEDMTETYRRFASARDAIRGLHPVDAARLRGPVLNLPWVIKLGAASALIAFVTAEIVRLSAAVVPLLIVALLGLYALYYWVARRNGAYQTSLEALGLARRIESGASGALRTVESRIESIRSELTRNRDADLDAVATSTVGVGDAVVTFLGHEMAALATRVDGVLGQLPRVEIRPGQSRLEDLEERKAVPELFERLVGAIHLGEIEVNAEAMSGGPALVPAFELSGGPAHPRSFEFDLRLGTINIAVPSQWQPDATGRPKPTEILMARLPLTSSAPWSSYLAIEGGPAGVGDELLRSVVLRLVVGSPAGEVRLTLIDPVGAGSGLAVFRTLPQQVRGERVLTSPDEIERRLEALAREAEEVIQARLGAKHQTLDAYNAANPAVAQPHHVIAILGLPAGGWTERGLTSLGRLARTGPRAGIHVVVTLDRAVPAPRGVDLDTVFGQVTRVTLDEKGLGRIDDPELGDWAFTPDKLPEPARVEALLEEVRAAFGRPRARLSSDVLVPLDWSGDTTAGISVPVGIDTEGQLAEFALGHGTVHHALIGGMTQSGKTTLLRLLVDQLASRYSPDELGLYLLDFKVVAFADCTNLPHARAVSLDTEREFALSALRELKAELDRRIGIFRGIGEYVAYRTAGHNLPRLVFVMDEYQVLFDDDDALAREAEALLADLVKRGAGLGVHVILASQHPSSAGVSASRVYSQIGLRIALQTRPADAAAILGEGNAAAGLLEQPGEAILNDALGSREHNRRFRVAFVAEDEHRSRIAAIVARDAGTHGGPVTFEGATPASLSFNPRLRELRAGTWHPEAGTADAFLGEPVELKGPTASRFERYPRANLLVAGPDETEAYGLLEAAIVSLALQQPEASFVVLDFARPSSPVAGVLPELARRLPDQVALAGPRDAGTALEAALADLAARMDGGDPASGSRYLVIAGVHRWRELRGGDGYNKLAPEATGLLRLAEEGPDHAWHVIAWTDGLAAMDRVLGRGASGKFDLRAATRVPEADSNALFDSPAAARLGDNRALYRHEEWALGQTEKFKPYRLLGPEGLDALLSEPKGDIA